MSEDAETFLGGFYGPFGASFGHFGIIPPFVPSGSSVGVGVYATNKRLFILGGDMATFPSSLNKIASAGSGKGDFFPSNLTKDQNDAIIGILIENKRFEISRSQVSQIELKKPPFLRTGWLKITSADGQTLDIRISMNMQYEWIVRVVQAFKPEAVTFD